MLVTPFPLPTPNWANQSLSPAFTPAFRLGFRYIPNEANDIRLSWTRLKQHQRRLCVCPAPADDRAAV